MYEEYWGLNKKPFDNVADASFYYPSEAHQGALLKLRYVLDHGRGAASLAGPAGVGKTVLIDTLFRQMPDSVHPRVHLVFPKMDSRSLLAFLAEEIAGPGESTGSATADASVRKLRNGLAENTRRGRHTLLAIDEAHLLCDHDTLETMRLLLNFQTDGRADLTLLLVGQPAFLAHLNRTPPLEERMGVKCLLRPFNEDESVSYICHRLTAANATRTLFDSDAMVAVHHASLGIARRINRICDLALLVAFADQLDAITAEQIESVTAELVTVAPE